MGLFSGAKKVLRVIATIDASHPTALALTRGRRRRKKYKKWRGMRRERREGGVVAAAYDAFPDEVVYKER